MLTTKQRSTGIGLLELMLSLLVIAIIIFTATKYFTLTSENLRVAQAGEMVNNITDASYKWSQGQPDFTNVSIQALNLSGFLPNDYDKGPWPGSTISIAPDSTKQKIVITITGMTATACQNLAEKMVKYGAVVIPCNPSTTFQGTF